MYVDSIENKKYCKARIVSAYEFITLFSCGNRDTQQR